MNYTSSAVPVDLLERYPLPNSYQAYVTWQVNSYTPLEFVHRPQHSPLAVLQSGFPPQTAPGIWLSPPQVYDASLIFVYDR